MLIQDGFRKNRNCVEAKPVYHGAHPARDDSRPRRIHRCPTRTTELEVARVLLKSGAVLGFR